MEIRNFIPRVANNWSLTISFRRKTKNILTIRPTSQLLTSATEGRFTHSMLFPCRAPAMPCREGFRMCLSHMIYTVRPCLIHTCHAMPMPCSDHAVLLKATAQHGRRETAVLCCGLEKNGMVGAWHGQWNGKCESDTAALCKS